MGSLLGASASALGGFAASKLSLGRRFGASRFREEDRRAFPAVIVGAHVARTAKGDQVAEGVVAGESKRLDVVNVERAPVNCRCLSTRGAVPVALSNLSLGLFPSGSVVDGRPAAPFWIVGAVEG
jgi:hypothetical protein